MFEKLYIVNSKQLEKIHESPEPFLSYSEIYEAIVDVSKKDKLNSTSTKLVPSVWLELKK